MGWVIKGEISPELEQPLFSASTSSVYGEPIKSQGGYHIVKTEEKLTDKESGQESVKARQILVAIDINNYLKELMDKATIKKFVRKM
jgi:parvulin-like peptidyl-prolyl isomerase